MAIGRIPEPGTGIPESIIAAKGDLIAGTANDTPGILTAGSNETRLVADSSTATGLKYVADTTNYAIAAKGDLLVGTGADTLAALTVGTNGHTLVADSATATGLKWAAPAGGGKVLQVVSVEYSTSTTIATSSYTDTGLSASITPSATSSKILIIITQQVFMTRQSNSAVNSDYRVLRGATQIGATGALTQISGGTDSAGSLTIRYPLAFTFLDSPNTTSSTTYKSQIAIGQTSNSGNIVCQSNTTASTITLIEIGA